MLQLKGIPPYAVARYNAELEDRRVMHISCIDMEQEGDLGHQQLRKNALNQQNEILHLPDIHSLGNDTHVDNNDLQKEFFSLKIRNCALFKAVPLPHIGKKGPLHLSDAAIGAASSKESLSLPFSPERDPFEKLFHHFHSTTVTGWLERAHKFISDMGVWNLSADNFVRFAHFWLSELQDNQKQQLLELEMGVIEDEVRLAFLGGPDSKGFHPSDLNSILAAALSEYPMGLVNNQNPYVFLDYLNLMSSANTPGYKKMLSSIQYTTKNPQIAQWLLAIRAFALANLWHAIVKALPVPNVNQAAENGNTPLHAAVNTGRMHLVSLLLHYPGINVDVPNPQCDGATALHLAIAYGHLGICYLLLNASVDVESPMEGLTPLQLAKMFGNETITGLIQMHAKKFKLESKMLS